MISIPAITLSNRNICWATFATNRWLGSLVRSNSKNLGTTKRDTLPRYCRECEVRFACHGECPKNRFIETPDGEPGLNYLCAGYKAFFKHIDRPMKIMAELLRRDRAPAEVMQILSAEESRLRSAMAGTGRNDPCPCGSGRKFKRCHGAASETRNPCRNPKDRGKANFANCEESGPWASAVRKVRMWPTTRSANELKALQ